METKRKAYPYPYSLPDSKEDYTYIRKHFLKPQNYNLIYSYAFEIHLAKAFDKKYHVHNKDDHSVISYATTERYAEKYFNLILGTDVEPFCHFLVSRYLMPARLIENDFDGFFNWMERAETLDSFQPLGMYDDHYVSLKYILHKPIYNFIELLGAVAFLNFPPNLTPFGREHRKEIFDEAQIIYSNLEDPYILDSFIDPNHTRYHSKYSDLDCYIPNTKQEYYSLCLYTNESLKAFCKEIIRKSENIVRNHYGLKEVGGGWVQETNLYNKLCNHYTNFKIIRSYRSKWLGSQHIDIFFPEYNIAIEFQGEQHFIPIDLFGGKEQFAKRIELDLQKREKCINNSVTMIWVVKEYNFDNLIKLIDGIIKGRCKKRFYILGKTNFIPKGYRL